MRGLRLVAGGHRRAGRLLRRCCRARGCTAGPGQRRALRERLEARPRLPEGLGDALRWALGRAGGRTMLLPQRALLQQHAAACRTEAFNVRLSRLSVVLEDIFMLRTPTGHHALCSKVQRGVEGKSSIDTTVTLASRPCNPSEMSRGKCGFAGVKLSFRGLKGVWVCIFVWGGWSGADLRPLAHAESCLCCWNV